MVLLSPLTPLVLPTGVKGKMELREMQKMAISIVYRIESLVEELVEKRERMDHDTRHTC